MADPNDKRADERGDENEIDPDAPPSAEEIAASQRLRDALADPSIAHDHADLARALRAAWAPAAIGEGENMAILDAMPSADELATAAALRDALDAKDAKGGASTETAGAQLARAMRCAYAPVGIDAEEHRALVEAALAKMPARTGRVAEVIPLRRRADVVRVAIGVVTGGLALAASVMLVVTSTGTRAETPLARARTTQPLFSEPFKAGDTSARIDRIASARASDFRDNRFAKWGVR